MSTDADTPGAARAAELLRRTAESAEVGGGARRLLRRLLLRSMRPFTAPQRELDQAVVAALARQEGELQHAQQRLDERVERLEEIAQELIATAESQRRLVSRSVGAISAELEAAPFIEGDPFGPLETPLGEAYGYRSRGEVFDAESDYVAFENLFRGSAERVLELQRPYLELLRDHEPVLEMGCGRGEFLAEMRAHGISASGLDTDAGMVEHCTERGLDVVRADAGEQLASLQDASLGAVFSAQVIEHIPYPELVRLLDLALAKLRPGGLFVAETVNPHRIASLKTFWVDPTHQHPIFPEVALAMCAIAGFAAAYVFAPGFESFPRSRSLAPSYAVVATAPAA